MDHVGWGIDSTSTLLSMDGAHNYSSVKVYYGVS